MTFDPEPESLTISQLLRLNNIPHEMNGERAILCGIPVLMLVDGVPVCCPNIEGKIHVSAWWDGFWNYCGTLKRPEINKDAIAHRMRAKYLKQSQELADLKET